MEITPFRLVARGCRLFFAEIEHTGSISGRYEPQLDEKSVTGGHRIFTHGRGDFSTPPSAPVEMTVGEKRSSCEYKIKDSVGVHRKRWILTYSL